MAQRTNPLSTASQIDSKVGAEANMNVRGIHSVSQRLQKELMSLMMNPEKGVSAFPDGENFFKWVATITGPANTVYEDCTYKLAMEFPKTYPYAAPEVKFSSLCYHPNVDSAGNICLDILKEKWSALYDVRSVLLSIQSLLGDPNVNSPLNMEAAEKWSNQEEYRKAMRSYQK